MPFTDTCDDLKSWGILSEDCHNRLSALALSEVGEEPCGLKSEASSAAARFAEKRREANGKTPKEIVVALMRKIITIAQAVLKSQTPFNAALHAN